MVPGSGFRVRGSPEQSFEVSAENLRPIGFGNPCGPGYGVLRRVHRLLPSSGEERRVRSEDHALRAHNRHGVPEHCLERQARAVLHPSV